MSRRDSLGAFFPRGILAVPWLLAALCATWASDWSRWRGPDGTGISTEKDWKPQALATAKIRWKASLGEGHSSVSVAGKRLYTMGNQGGNDTVFCLDAESGKELWKHSYPCAPGNYEGTRATPVIDGEQVYTLSREGHVFCLEAATGKVIWQKHLIQDYRAVNNTWGMAGSPLILGNSVIYNARASGLALDKATGAKIWESGGGQSGYASPVHFTHKGKDCLALFSFKDLVVVDAQTGAKLFSHPWETQYDVNAADPVYFEGKLFITSGYERGCALLDLSGDRIKVAWESKEMRGHFASPIFFEGHLYGVDGQTGNGQLRCLDVQRGQIKWTQRGGYENLMMAAGKLIVIDKHGVLTVAEASPKGFREIAHATVLTNKIHNWAAPVLANGLIYCRDSKGDLVCVDVR